MKIRPTMLDARIELARAIRRASEEHGRPNSFSPGELRLLYGGPSPLLAGRIGRRYIVQLWKLLGGHEGWGSCPVYAEDTKRFYV
jgi:hypothetical protein